MTQNRSFVSHVPTEATGKRSTESAVVVLSGGQDSVTCLGYALKVFGKVHAIGFQYGQRHAVELEQAKIVCDKLGVDFSIFTIPALAKMADSVLLSKEGSFNNTHERNDDLPASFVPNRNAMFLTIAHAFAQKMGADHILTGVCETDYSGYPDCRQAFIDEFAYALNTGYLTSIQIHTPLMHLNKAQTFALAEQCGILDIVIEDSHTCYEGDRRTKHDWGYGCGKCPACELRRKGYREFLAEKLS